MDGAAEDRGRELAQLLADGHPDAVRRLYQAYGRLVYSVTYKILNDHGNAEEATQTAFTKIWQAADRVDPARDIRPLLLTSARRVAFDLLESGRRRPTSPLDETIATPAVADATDQLLTRWQVREALDTLPDDERQIVRLQHLEGLTHTEIAQHLNMPVGTVKSRSFRAHKKLLHQLRPPSEEVG